MSSEPTPTSMSTLAAASDAIRIRLAPGKPEGYIVHHCRQAEPRLRAAMRIGALMLVDGVMVMKGNGELVGTPLKDVVVTGGRLEVGVWYAPTHAADMRHVKDAYDTGATRLALSEPMDWSGDRALEVGNVMRGSAQDLAASLADAVERAPGGPVLNVDFHFRDEDYTVAVSRRLYRLLCLDRENQDHPEPYIRDDYRDPALDYTVDPPTYIPPFDVSLL